jgi:hypothetical protein
MIACPCCHHLTLAEADCFEICPVCFWEDDGQNETDADEKRRGPNGGFSLTQARRNYRTIGASDARFLTDVRLPRPDEIPD